MLVVLCILWVLNMACAAQTTNRIWHINALIALFITIDIAENFPL